MPLVRSATRDGKRGLSYDFHPSQRRAWDCRKRTLLILAGARGGKTSFGPPWLHREMLEKGPGDYIVAGPSFQILDKAAVGEVEEFFGRTLRLGVMKRQPLQFAISPEGHQRLWRCEQDRPRRIIFGHADDPDSLEAMTGKAAWLDEAGQKRFRLQSREAIRRRLSLDRGRELITTTPYDMGWLKQQIYDPWEQAGRDHPDIDVIQFDSTENPTFPREEWEKARREMPAWRFNMFYRGRFSRPAGQIYDCFDEDRHVIDPIPIPPDWPRHLGLDFGGANTAAVFVAMHPETKQLYLYREYHAGARTAAEHTEKLLSGEAAPPVVAVGGSRSEGQWRREFALAGLPVAEPPIPEVEVGINRVYAALATGRLVIFRTCERLLDELQSYSRVLDERGDPTEVIEDKEFYHNLDALRYLGSWLVGDCTATWKPEEKPSARSYFSQAPEGVFLDGDGQGW